MAGQHLTGTNTGLVSNIKKKFKFNVILFRTRLFFVKHIFPFRETLYYCDMPLLIEALQHGRYRQVQLALQVGWNVNERDRTNWRTPLIQLSFLDKEDMAVRFCKRFLDKGAKIGLRDNNGRNALHFACLNSREKLVELMLQEVEGFDLNDRDHQGNTALTLAAASGNFVVVRTLLKVLKRYRLSVDVSNNHGETPLILASKTQNCLVSEILISEGKASTEIRDERRHLTAEEWKEKSGKLRFSRLEHVGSISLTKRSGSSTRKTSKLSSVKPQALNNDYKDELYKLFNVYHQQLTSSYRPSVVPPPVKDENDSSEVSVLSESGDFDSICTLDTDDRFATCSVEQPRSKKRFSVATTVQIPLTVNKMRRQKFSPSKTAEKNQGASSAVGQEVLTRSNYRRGSINVFQKLQVSVKKRSSCPLLRQRRSTLNNKEMMNLQCKLEALTEEA